MSDQTTPAPLDRAALNELNGMVGGDPAFLAEMIDAFLDDSPTLLAAMESAVTAGDAPAVRRAAHTLKSNCRTFGALTLAGLCQEIEGLAVAGQMAATVALVRQAASDYPGVATALRAERSDE